MDQSGKDTAIIEGENHHCLGHFADGLFYFGPIEDDVFSVYGVSPKDDISSGFYDISGKRVIDLGKYRLRTAPVFSDGFCVLNLYNPQRVRYYTVIDKSGKEMFEPRQSPTFIQFTDSKNLDLSTKCGMIVIRDHQNSPHWDSACSVLNITGNKVAEFRDGYTRVSNYSEDVALVKHKKDMTYNRDSPDEIYYIDKTGKRLF